MNCSKCKSSPTLSTEKGGYTVHYFTLKHYGLCYSCWVKEKPSVCNCVGKTAQGNESMGHRKDCPQFKIEEKVKK